MRVLLTTDTVGGVWTYTRELTQGLLTQHCSVCLVSFGRKPDAVQSAWISRTKADAGSRFDFAASDAPLEWEQENAQAYEAGAPLLLELVKSFGADLLHSNQFCFGALPVAIPKVVAAHSDVLSWAEACRPEGLEISPSLERYVRLTQRGLDGAHAVVAPTHWMLSALERNFPLHMPTSVIANGRTLPTIQAARPRRLQAATAGRVWDPAKNLPVLDELDSPLPIVVAGETVFHDQRAFLFKRENITYAGSLAEADLLSLFAESAIYLATSVYEPFGLAPLEAALCGCAVVAKGLPSLREVWGDAALFFESSSDLKRLLERLVAAPQLLVEAQRRSEARARALSAGRMTDAYLQLYAELVGRNSAGRPQLSAPEVAAYAS